MSTEKPGLGSSICTMAQEVERLHSIIQLIETGLNIQTYDFPPPSIEEINEYPTTVEMLTETIRKQILYLNGFWDRLDLIHGEVSKL